MYINKKKSRALDRKKLRILIKHSKNLVENSHTINIK